MKTSLKLLFFSLSLLQLCLLTSCGGGGGGGQSYSAPAFLDAEAVSVSSCSNGYASSPDMAMDANGNVSVVYICWQDNIYHLFANYFDTDRHRWTGQVALESVDNASLSAPQVSVNAAGDGFAIWTSGETSDFHTTYVARYDAASSSWQAPQALEDNSTDNSYNAQIVVDDNGNALATWYRWDGEISRIWINRYDAETSSWGTASYFDLESGNAYVPQLVMDDAGNVMLVWYAYASASDTTRSVWARRYTAADDSWSTAELIEESADTALSPEMAIDSLGNVFVTWFHSSSTGKTIWVNRFDAETAAWEGAQQLTTPLNFPRYPVIATDSQGDVVIVWSNVDDDGGTVWTSRYDADSSSWSAAEQLNSTACTRAHSGSVYIDSQDNVYAFWPQFDDSGYTLWFSSYRADEGSWSTAIDIAGPDVTISYPQIRIDRYNRGTAVWFQRNADSTTIMALYGEMTE